MSGGKRGPQRSMRVLRHPITALSAWCGLSLGIAIVLLGCGDPVSKYHTLSFFFDGVPPPPGVTPPPARYLPNEEGFVSGPALAATTRPATSRPAQPVEQPIVSLHAPYARRQCDECHSREASFSVPVTVDICRKCHLSYYELKWDDWAHGPVAAGRCSLCHVQKPHKSEFPSLLASAMPTVCFSCHNAAETRAAPYHAAAGDQPCTGCHDPHSAGNRLLLADSTTYQRRANHAKAYPSPHSGWTRENCSLCHLTAQSNQLIAEVDRACLGCHAKVVEAGGDGKLHEAVSQGKCTSCHTAHTSTRPHLIKPLAERICLGCHELKEIETASHTPMHRADCLLCHTGHRSSGKHLLGPLGEALWAPVAASGPSPASTTGPYP